MRKEIRKFDILKTFIETNPTTFYMLYFVFIY